MIAYRNTNNNNEEPCPVCLCAYLRLSLVVGKCCRCYYYIPGMIAGRRIGCTVLLPCDSASRVRIRIEEVVVMLRSQKKRVLRVCWKMLKGLLRHVYSDLRYRNAKAERDD